MLRKTIPFSLNASQFRWLILNIAFCLHCLRLRFIAGLLYNLLHNLQLTKDHCLNICPNEWLQSRLMSIILSHLSTFHITFRRLRNLQFLSYFMKYIIYFQGIILCNNYFVAFLVIFFKPCSKRTLQNYSRNTSNHLFLFLYLIKLFIQNTWAIDWIAQI